MQVKRQTLSDRIRGRTKSIQEANEDRKLLNTAQEQALVDWCTFYAFSANPLSRKTLRGLAEAITGKIPGKHWHVRFLARYPQLVQGLPTGLDPARAKNFNPTVVSDYFSKRTALHDTYDGIPPENEWNMDEKGIQMGGGRKRSGEKFIFDRSQKSRYCIQNDNLELVTVIECVSAAGASISPSFILKKGTAVESSHIDGVGT